MREPWLDPLLKSISEQLPYHLPTTWWTLTPPHHSPT